ncbi:MAG: DinB family protein [Chitinophagaceae bacterium]|jgi:hypothetical protein|nr:DinB family protein [Chitinophagaceae bacterium]
MNKVAELIHEVKKARMSYLEILLSVTEEQAQWKPSPDTWNMVEITEHLYWAEHGAIFGMWKSLHAIRSGKMERKLESIHQDLPIGEIIGRTWKAKEQVPAVAAPRMGGTLDFWRYALGSLQEILAGFGADLQEDELRLQAHPHPISGPMDFQQRLEFLEFHIERHMNQVQGLIDSRDAKP